MTSSSQTALSEDSIDDLLYDTRAGDLSSLTSRLTELSTEHNVPTTQILCLAIDSESKNTPLHYAAANGHLPITTFLLSLLPASPSTPDVTAKTILNAQNGAGNTPLHWAGLNGHLEIVKALVNAGADPGVRNKAGRDAIVEAEIASESAGDKGKKAGECAVWILEKWAGAEEGVGGSGDGVNGRGNGDLVNGSNSKDGANDTTDGEKP